METATEMVKRMTNKLGDEYIKLLQKSHKESSDFLQKAYKNSQKKGKRAYILITLVYACTGLKEAKQWAI